MTLIWKEKFHMLWKVSSISHHEILRIHPMCVNQAWGEYVFPFLFRQKFPLTSLNILSFQCHLCLWEVQTLCTYVLDTVYVMWSCRSCARVSCCHVTPADSGLLPFFSLQLSCEMRWTVSCSPRLSLWFIRVPASEWLVLTCGGWMLALLDRRCSFAQLLRGVVFICSSFVSSSFRRDNIYVLHIQPTCNRR